MLPEPYKTPFFEGLRAAVAEHGGKAVFEDTYVLYLTKKPLNQQNADDGTAPKKLND